MFVITVSINVPNTPVRGQIVILNLKIYLPCVISSDIPEAQRHIMIENKRIQNTCQANNN